MIIYNRGRFHIKNSSSLPLKELKPQRRNKFKLSSENKKILKSLGFALQNKNE